MNMFKKILIICFAILFATTAWGKGFFRYNPHTGKLDYYGAIKSTTIGSLPTAASGNAGEMYLVTDGSTAADCTSGGGSTYNVCVSNGSAWVAVGDGTGGAGSGSVTTVEEGDSQVGGADIVSLDFAAGEFVIAEDPDTEINISIDLGPSDGSATLISEQDALQVKYSSDHMTEGSGGLALVANGIDDTLIDWGTGTNQVSGADFANEDLGDISIASGSWTLDADVVAAAEMADGDHGMVSWSSGSATVEDFALNADADAGDYDIKSLDKLEGYDTGVYIDMGADSYTDFVSDGGWRFYDAVNNGDPLIEFGAATAEALHITGDLGESDQLLDSVTFTTKTSQAGADSGKVLFKIDEAQILQIDDAGIEVGETSVLDGIITMHSDQGHTLSMQPHGTTTDNLAVKWPAAAPGSTLYLQMDATGQISTASGTAQNTAWDDLQVPDADESLAHGGYTTLFTSTLDSAVSEYFFTLSNTDADLSNTMTVLGLKMVDDADADGFFLKAVDSSSGTPNTVFSIGANGAVHLESSIEFEGSTDDGTNVTTLAVADPSSATTATIPNETGTFLLGPAGLGTDNILVKTDGTGNLTQATGISVDDSNNVTGVAGLTGTGAVTGGTVTDGTVTLAGDGTVTGISEGGLPNSIVVSADIKDDTIDSADYAAASIDEEHLKVVNSPTDEDIFTFESTTGDFEWHTLAELNIQPLESTLTDIADGTIAENLVNTANPWADNEVADTLTVTAQAGSTWDVADSVTVTSVYSGSTSLDESTGATDSGAYIIGVYDEFTNSNSTTVQGVLNDLDGAIAVTNTAYDDIQNPDASGSISFASYTGTYTSSSSGWDGIFISDTVATVAGATELLTLSFSDGEGSSTGQLNFLTMVANSTTLYEADEDGVKVGTGTPTNALDGGDVYITDDVEIDGTLTLGALEVAGAAAPVWTWNDSDAAGGATTDEAAMRIHANLATVTEDDEVADWRIDYMHDDGVTNANAAYKGSLVWLGSDTTLQMGVLAFDNQADWTAADESGYESLKFDFNTATDAEVTISSPSSTSQLDIQIATLKTDAMDIDGAIDQDGGAITSTHTAPVLTLEDSTGAAGDIDFVFASSGAYDVVGNIQVDEGGTAVDYMVFDGANDVVIVGQASPNDNNVSFQIEGDADSDAAGDTSEALSFTLTGNATPTSSSWAITDTQGSAINLTSTAGDVILNAKANDQDIIFNVDDGGTDWAVIIDGSEPAVDLDADNVELSFGDNQDVYIKHDPDDGLFMKSAATTDDNPFVLTIQTGETDIAASDVLGGIYFQAPDEGTGTDAILVAAGIEAVSEGDFSATSNATKLSFKTGASEVASEKMALSSAGVLTLGSGGIVIPDTSTIGSASDTDAMSIAADGDVDVVNDFTAGTITSDAAVTATTNVVIGDAGNIGSASDTDAIAIAANGEATFSQEIQASAGIDASGQTIIASNFTGTASLATTVTVSDDESTDDSHEVVFTTDNTNLESDGDLTYNPNSGTLSATYFNGTLTSPTLTGVVDMGGATSVEIVADANPTTDETGEIAIDSNDDFIEFYDGTASRIVGSIIAESFSIIEPDTIAGIEDEVLLKQFVAEAYPHGVTMVSIHVGTDGTDVTNDSINFERWTGEDDGSPDTMENIDMTGVDNAEDDGTIDNSPAADDYIVADISGWDDDIPMLIITITYRINAGD